jgi:hypothetical protein
MTPRAPGRPVVLAVLALLVLVVLGLLLAPTIAGSRLRAEARARGLAVQWGRLDLVWPSAAHIRELSLRHVRTGDTLLAAAAVDVRLRVLPLLIGHARIASLSLADARVHLPAGDGAAADTLVPVPEPAPGSGTAVAPLVKRKADEMVGLLLVPARRLPELHLHDVRVWRGEERILTLDGLELTHDAHAVNLALAGIAHGTPDTPFDALVRWQHDDRFTARAELRMKDSRPPSPPSLLVTVEGRVTQDARARELRVADGTTLHIGRIAAGITARVGAAGPRFRLAVAADHLSEDDFRRSLPARVLGPLAGLELHGTFDWHAGVDLDLAHPDSVRFNADVTPHELWLDPQLSRPSLQAIGGPFTAQIHLPREQIAIRELSDANPHYRPLERISPWLRDGVLTNEDGGFWRHRGFNTEAITLALAENLRVGSYKRGAGTITMQLARNLWLGHQRTLARKAQEVALAWLLEHETGLSKERLLEVYLNIIEWGPDIHGADEAAHYFFDEDASQLSLPEALFLTIVVPSPGRWRWRFAPDGTLRPYARAQMRFIARKMAAKGWLDPALVPTSDSIVVTLRGPARELFERPEAPQAAVDSLSGEPI